MRKIIVEIENGKIYKITNVLNGKLYIGMTTRPIVTRWKQHLCDVKRSKCSLYKAMREYGVNNFKCEVIIDGIHSIEELRELEKHYIKECGSFENGYNSTLGGLGSLGHKHTLEHRLYLSKVLTGRKQTPEHRERNRQARIGYKQSKETIEKRMKYVRGIPKSPEHRDKLAEILRNNTFRLTGKDHPKSVEVLQISIETGEIVGRFDTIIQAETSLGHKANNGSICKVINGKCKTAYGFKWERAKGRDLNS